MNTQLYKVILLLALVFNLTPVQAEVFLVDADQKFCFTTVNKQVKSRFIDYRYIDVGPFNKKSLSESRCRTWKLVKYNKKIERKKLYQLISNNNMYLHVDKNGAFIFKEKVTKVKESLWYISAKARKVIIKSFAYGFRLGITERGLFAETGTHKLKFVRGSSPDINETYEYIRSYRNGYTIKVKETPESVDNKSQGQQQNDVYQNDQGQQQNDVYENEQGQQDDGQYNDGENSESEIENTSQEEQKKRLKIANSSFDAGLYGEAFQEYEALANEDMGIAQYYVGSSYQTGKGVEKKDVARMLKWYRLAADNNIPEAAYQLARLYYYGKLGFTQNYQTAAYWANKALEEFKLSGDKNVRLAMEYLYAMMLENGHGVPKDLKRALSWYEFVMGRDRYQYPISDDIARVRKLIKSDRLDSFKNSFRRF